LVYVCYTEANGMAMPGRGVSATTPRMTKGGVPLVEPQYTPSQPQAAQDGLTPRQRRRLSRIARGLPPYSDAEMAHEARRAKARERMRYDQRRALIDEIKLARGCADCGFKAHPAALEFDHLPGSRKVRTIARMSSGRTSLTTLEAEMAKCEAVCANCHAIREAQRREERARSEGNRGGL